MAGRRGAGKGRGEPEEEDLEHLRPDEEDFLSFLEDIGANCSFVEIFRILKSGDPEWLDLIAFDEIRDGLGYIRDTYGPGKYQIKFKDAGKKYRGSKTVLVGAVASKIVNGQTAGLQGDPRVTFLTEQMTMQQTLMFKLIEGMATSNRSGPASDPAAMLTAVVTAFSVLKGASDPNTNVNAVKQLKETLDLVAGAKDIFGESGGAKEENMYTVLKELGNKFLGGGPGMPAMPADGGAPVRTIHPGGVPFKISQLNPDGTRTAAAPAAAPDAGGGDVVAWIKAGLAYLKSKAKLGKPVTLYQDLIFDHQEEPQFQALLQAIEQGATFENLLQFDPEIAQTPTLLEWFKALYDDVHAEISKPLDTTGPGGDPPNARGDAASSTEGQPKP